MYPPPCNESCVAKRFQLYIFYGVLFSTLIILALSHFIVFVVYRRRSKEETKDYMARKHEFFALSLTDLRLEKEARDIAALAEMDLGALSEKDDSLGDGSDTGSEYQCQVEAAPEDSFSPVTSALSLLDIRRMGVEGLLPGLQRIDEENLADTSRSSTSSTVSRGRNATKTSREPVIVTVATVSAIFEEEVVKADGEDWKQRRNSVMDISDIIDSPRKLVSQPQNHFDFTKSNDGTLSGHFAKRGSDHSRSTMNNHRDITHNEQGNEGNEEKMD